MEMCGARLQSLDLREGTTEDVSISEVGDRDASHQKRSPNYKGPEALFYKFDSLLTNCPTDSVFNTVQSEYSPPMTLIPVDQALEPPRHSSTTN